MATDERSTIERLADSMGQAAEQLKDALLKLLELYREHQEKMRKASEEQQAALKKQFSKTLQAEGFEPSDENIAILRNHAAKIEGAQKEVGDLKTQLAEMDGMRSSEAVKNLRAEREGLVNDRRALLEGEETPDRQAQLEKLDQRMADLDKGLADVSDDRRAALEKKLTMAEGGLDRLNKGEGLEALKPDMAKNALKTFKANSVGEKLMQTNGLSETMQVKLGVKLKPDGEGGLSGKVKINVPKHG